MVLRPFLVCVALFLALIPAATANNFDEYYEENCTGVEVEFCVYREWQTWGTYDDPEGYLCQGIVARAEGAHLQIAVCEDYGGGTTQTCVAVYAVTSVCDLGVLALLGANPDLWETFGTLGDIVLILEDQDQDRIPDQLEGQMCGRQAVENLLNEEAVPGHCESSADYSPPPVTPESLLELVEALVGQVLDLYGDLLDDDGDLIPDVVEPVICQVEDQNSDLDGSCDGDDYTLP